MRIFMLMSSIFTCMFIIFFICQLEINSRGESRLKNLEAAMHSVQQPLERNYFADAGNAVISFRCGDTVHLFGFRVTAK